MTSNNLPAIPRTPANPPVSLTPTNAYRSARAVQRYSRDADVRTRCELVDVHASAEVAHSQLTAEVTLLLAGLQMANGDEAIQYLVSQKVAAFAESNTTRLVSRFR